MPSALGGYLTSMNDDSTIRRLLDGRTALRPVWHRRLGVAALALIVLAGATGFLGVHSRTVSASADGYTLTVTYAGIARPGLDVPLKIVLTSDKELVHDIEIAVSSGYFDIFETQGFHPDPSGTASDGHYLYFTFDPPPSGKEFVVDYDAYIQPASQRGSDARISFMSDDKPVVTVDISTFLFP